MDTQLDTLEEIFAVKNLREAKALGAVRKQDRVVAEAISRRDEAQVSLQHFSLFSKQREAQLFLELQQNPAGFVRLRDIEEVQVQVGELRTKEGEYKTALVQAEDTQARETERLVNFKAAHVKACREQQKFDELVRIQVSDEALHLERSEENEATATGRAAGLPLEVRGPAGAAGG